MRSQILTVVLVSLVAVPALAENWRCGDADFPARCVAREWADDSACPCSHETVCADEGLPAGHAAVFCEDWDDLDHAGWDWNDRWDDNCPEDLGCIEDGAGTEGSGALHGLLFEDSPEDAAASSALVVGEARVTQPVYMRWYFRLSEGYQLMAGGDGQKHMYYMMDRGSADEMACVMMGLRGNEAGDTVGRLNMSNCNGHWPIWSAADCVGCDTEHFGPDFPNVITGGRWYCVETLARLNDPGTDSGYIRMWIDGHLYNKRDAMGADDFGDNHQSDSTWTELPWQSYYYGMNPPPPHPEQSIWYDNLVVVTAEDDPLDRDTSLIGCLGDAGPIPVDDPPSDPVDDPPAEPVDDPQAQEPEAPSGEEPARAGDVVAAGCAAADTGAAGLLLILVWLAARRRTSSVVTP